MRLECKPDTNINIHFSEADMQIILLNIIIPLDVFTTLFLIPTKFAMRMLSQEVVIFIS